MKSAEIKILSTRLMADPCLEEAARQGIHIAHVPLIKVIPVSDASIDACIKSLAIKNIMAVFTSINAVTAVIEKLEKQPAWEISCISGQTAAKAEAFFTEEQVVVKGINSKELAENIIAKQPKLPVIFFCGNMRMQYLPDSLAAANINIKEVIVYHTIAMPLKVEETYNGIAFFSPSAVDSFFQLNKVQEHISLFAIGNTTANHIKKYTKKEVLCSDQPSQQSITERIINYYDQERSFT